MVEFHSTPFHHQPRADKVWKGGLEGNACPQKREIFLRSISRHMEFVFYSLLLARGSKGAEE